MTARELGVLRSLDDKLWLRPMDVGGTDGSHHSATLKRLVQQGLAAERRGGNYARGTARHGFRYRRTAAGRAALEAQAP